MKTIPNHTVLLGWAFALALPACSASGDEATESISESISEATGDAPAARSPQSAVRQVEAPASGAREAAPAEVEATEAASETPEVTTRPAAPTESRVAPVDPTEPSAAQECAVICSRCSEPLAPGVAVDCLPSTAEQMCVAESATCERQQDGSCGYTETAESAACSALN